MNKQSKRSRETLITPFIPLILRGIVKQRLPTLLSSLINQATTEVFTITLILSHLGREKGEG